MANRAKVVAKRNDRAKEVTKINRSAKRLDDIELRTPKRLMVDRIIGLEYVESLVEEIGNQDLAARIMGTSTRTLFAFRSGERNAIQFEFIEAAAHELGRADELYSEFPPPGKDGWASNGQRFCARCGSWRKPHNARGYCRPCYQQVRKYEREGRPVEPPKREKWSLRHDRCVQCGTTKVIHWAKGQCRLCYYRNDRLRKR